MTRRLAPLLLAAALAACAKTAAPTNCQSSAQCPEASRCDSGVCTADGRPIASFSPIGAPEAFALVELDGSSSHDPDAGDAIAEYLWTIRSVDAPCAPPEIAGHGAQPLVRFGCAGRYSVELVVRDGLGVEGAPATAEVLVSPPTGTPLVLAGPDLATEHVCRGSPLVCRTESRIVLAAAADPRLALHWSVLPPADRPLDPTRRVQLLPSASAAEPVAIIETDGTAISGDWIFRVEALDAYGVVGVAHTRVSVRNRAPVIEIAAAGAFPHVFDPGRSAFLSGGVLAWTIVDPDGDPFEVTGIWRHVGDGDGGTFDGDFDGSVVTFAVEVPYAAPEDALHLIGGVDLSRTIELYALDANRTQGYGIAEVRIGNRPPVPTGGAVDTVVPHRFDAAGSRYLAAARAGSYVDPDGDPMFGAPSDGPCGNVLVEGNDAVVVCAVPFLGVPALDRLVGKRTFPVRVRDPWEVAANVPVRTLEILNSAPAIAGSPSPATSCMTVQVDAMAVFFGRCGVYFHYAPVTFDVSPTVTDPDGDPVAVTATTPDGGSVTPTAAVCGTSACVPFHFVQPATTQACTTWYPVSTLTASDGAATVRLDVSPAPQKCN
ncbi:MAG TPA: hypothetical protein VF875_18560 [Anaeromyxobacter sp.]